MSILNAYRPPNHPLIIISQLIPVFVSAAPWGAFATLGGRMSSSQHSALHLLGKQTFTMGRGELSRGVEGWDEKRRQMITSSTPSKLVPVRGWINEMKMDFEANRE